MRLVLILIAVFSVANISNTFAATDKVNVIRLVSDEWCPYTCKPGDSPGYMIEIIKQVFTNLNYKIEYEILPWTRSIKHVREGKAEVLVGAAKSDAPDMIYPTEALGHMKNCFYGVKGKLKWHYDGSESLKKVKLTLINAYTYGEPVDSYVKENSENGKVEITSGSNAIDLIIAKVMNGKVDVFIENEDVITFHLKNKKFSAELENLGCVGEDEIHVGFNPNNKKSKEYSEILGQGLTELRKNGKLKTILDKYGLIDWKK
ncbi:MAG: transporter substrate-binding domain-containing protein [Oligoflexia bacterium]|nr:transporter substrate-binding domain-containing protein [Oligoflexia bacterium]MBF0367159.1 transporter substrate-binding domain-containing protein [Oligoflexia bacterium]